MSIYKYFQTIKFTPLALILLITHISNAQDGVSINATGADPDASAILDVSSTTQGALFPRMTQTDRDAIVSPATGLTVYQTDGLTGHYNWNGSAWVKVGAFEFDGTQAYFTGGNVGIGLPNPSYKLDVQGTGNFVNTGSLPAIRAIAVNGIGVLTEVSDNNAINAQNDSNTSAAIYAENDGTAAALRVNNTSTGNSIDIGNGNINTNNNWISGDGGDEGIVINNIGNVGIGTPIPDQLLSVNGNASKVGGGTWATFSDERVKKNISPFNEGLSTLQQINPVTFQYNGLAGYKNNGKAYVGIIAQDVQPIAPYMFEQVSKKLKEEDQEKINLWMYDSNALTYILVNAIKEQQAQIEVLKKQLTQKNGEVQSLQSDKEKLESSLQSLDVRLKEIERLLGQ